MSFQNIQSIMLLGKTKDIHLGGFGQYRFMLLAVLPFLAFVLLPAFVFAGHCFTISSGLCIFLHDILDTADTAFCQD